MHTKYLCVYGRVRSPIYGVHVLTPLRMCIQSVSLNVQHCTHKYLLPLCLGKPTAHSTTCLAKSEALHLSVEAHQS